MTSKQTDLYLTTKPATLHAHADFHKDIGWMLHYILSFTYLQTSSAEAMQTCT